MDVIGNEIEAIRESGVGNGLSDLEIDGCILAALKELNDTTAAITRSTPARPRGYQTKAKANPTNRSCFSKICFCGLYLAIFVVVAIVIVANSDESQKWIEKKIEPWVYTITKNWRLITLPLARTVDLDQFYNEECLLPNPFAIPETPPCDLCAKITKEHILYDVSAKQFEHTYMGQSQPLVVKGAHRQVTFDDLKLWYSKLDDVLRRSHLKLQNAPTTLTTIDEFLVNYTSLHILNNPDFYLEWITEAVNPSRMLRQLFPRQKFIPKKAEVNLRKTVMVIGPATKTFVMSRDDRAMLNQWYVQAAGSRELYLKPAAKCVEQCPHISIILEAGDILCYPNGHWTIESAPVYRSTDINVIFIGSFM